MKKYVYTNPYVPTKEQQESEVKKEKETDIPEPATAPVSITEVDLVLPKKLADAIDALGLSKTMKSKCLKLVDIITYKGMTEHKDLGAFVSLSASYLEKVFNKDYHNDFFNAMKQKQIIESDERYMQGSGNKKGFCKSYRICRQLLAAEYVIVSYRDKKKENPVYRNYLPQRDNSDRDSYSIEKEEINDSTSLLSIPISPRFFRIEERPLFSPRFFDKRQVIEDLSALSYDSGRITAMAKEHAAQIGSKLLIDEEVLTLCFEVVNKITGTYYFTTREKALAWCRSRQVSLIRDDRDFYIDDLESFIKDKEKSFLVCCEWQLAKLENGLFYANRNRTNSRLDHNLTNISRHVVETIKEDNDLVEIDLKNSQFAMHAFWMKKEGLCELHDDVRRYYEFCANGMLYDEIGSRMNLDRKEAKNLMMELAFASLKFHSRQKAWLREMFPNVVRHIDDFKRKNGSKAFAVELQKQEANIFIDNLYPTIKELGIFCLPKHDSFLIKRQDAGVVVELIQSFFQSIGFECALDIEGEKHLIQSLGD